MSNGKTAGAPVIVVDAITYAYGSLQAVRGISFQVHRGEIHGFLGPNGAGKSTTIKMLTGRLRPKSGSITIFGQRIDGHSPAVQARMGVCFEEKNLYLQMSAEENLKFFAGLFGITKPDVRSLLTKVGLVDRAKSRVSTFSKGMRQRLMIARALINDPEVIILDEPTDGLDPVSALAIREIITERARAGAAVLLTTHDMAEADRLSDRVAFINEGRIYANDTPENLKLQHGKRQVLVRRRTGDAGDEIDEQRLLFSDPQTGELLKTAAGDPNLLTIHTEEAGLDDIFVEMTGRGLQ